MSRHASEQNRDEAYGRNQSSQAGHCAGSALFHQRRDPLVLLHHLAEIAVADVEKIDDRADLQAWRAQQQRDGFFL
jgi:hypothetical protein